jgi:hypothetical protein
VSVRGAVSYLDPAKSTTVNNAGVAVKGLPFLWKKCDPNTVTPLPNVTPLPQWQLYCLMHNIEKIVTKAMRAG